MPMEKLFMLLIIGLVAIFGPFTYFTYLTVSDFIKNKPEGYRWP